MDCSISDIVFDFDGTLVDSAPGVIYTLSAILRNRCIRPQVPLNSNLIGPPLAEILARLTGWDDTGRLTGLIEDFKRIYDHEGVRSTAPYPGVDALLQTLSSQGMRLHIATNKRIHPTRLILKHLGWSAWFSSIYAIDMREPHVSDKAELIREQMEQQRIDPGSACYVGDRVEDGRAADSQPIPFFLAAWGYGENCILPPHWYRVAKPLDFPDLISSAKTDEGRTTQR